MLADGDAESSNRTAECLSREGYLVLVARDGFEALAELRAALPEVLISDLELPRMSGFELLAVVRKRFAGIGVIATSTDFYPAGMPEGVLADRYVRKNENSDFEICEVVRQLLTEFPLRAAPPRTDTAPVWLSRSCNGYIVVTCPVCLRSSSVRLGRAEFGVIREEACLSCGAKITYRLDGNIAERTPEPSQLERMQDRLYATRKTLKESKRAIDRSTKRMAEE